ncbi:MAG: type III pantothenate kinase [Bacteroidia bacterium]
MQLVIDIGNTRIKVAFFQNNEVKNFFLVTSVDELINATWFTDTKIEYALISSVAQYPENLIEIIKQKTTLVIFSATTPVPLVNKYKTAHTLGSDRLAAAVGGNFIFPNTNLLVIDAGTCLKYNFVNAQNEFLGGGISPGLQMRFNALHNFTAKLPLQDFEKNIPPLVGTDTTSSILSGVQNGILAEVEGIIHQYKEQYPNLKTILTGGDGDFFAKQLKNSIFADPFLVQKGLNIILNHNFNTQNIEKK